MTAKKPPAWQLPAILTSIVVGLGAIGTGVVKLAGFLTLPDRVEASEQANQRQDQAIDKLTAINETWQNIYTQQQTLQQIPNLPVPTEERREWRDSRTGQWWCCDTARCVDEDWVRC